ncbi:MAG TPA: NifB/NifX family molybdenum-iron cluster-binding protein [Candidatus Omnitrophota bacterium]|nr:NifB/NifX family molybdenum-iron cluster-binding protein [Candidatus Omnitrophota bacterium]HNQ50400.1 NifB/NifX family molybdenum-iron cluster-binding protein [Candidatus Omnitrophota bacterium]HQO37704.1 NifB/NifX family molybdenum-iron cluster-binding protein [Candidatus Omnitrophota bacterium]HQQ05953.1 NifB/NifX family molybdenum-iron cluster-binding protein [Candidatus Omnitrophota bacterium]
MKICITSEGKTLDSNVDSRFGRCRNFIFVETGTEAFEAVENPHTKFQGGAGIQSAQFVVTNGAKAVLTGNVGPNAFQTLAAAGVDVFVEVSGKVSDALKLFNTGKLTPAKDPSVGSKFGMGNMGR